MSAIGLVVALTAMATACSGAPDTVSFDGATLKKAKSFRLLDDAAATVYTDDGIEGHVTDAKLRVQLTVNEKSSASDENTFLTEQEGKGFSLDAWATEKTADTLCRVGRNVQNGRFFVEARVCAEKKKRAVCAGVDEEVPIPCNTGDEDCKKAKSAELCRGRVDAKRAALNAVIARAH